MNFESANAFLSDDVWADHEVVQLLATCLLVHGKCFEGGVGTHIRCFEFAVGLLSFHVLHEFFNLTGRRAQPVICAGRFALKSEFLYPKCIECVLRRELHIPDRLAIKV